MNSLNSINRNLVNKQKPQYAYSTFKTYVGVSSTTPTITISSALNKAQGIAIDTNLNIYYVESSNLVTSKIITTGTPPTRVDYLTQPSGRLSYNTAVDKDNNVYTSNTFNGLVYKNQTTTNPISLTSVLAIAFDNSNNMFLSTAASINNVSYVYYYQFTNNYASGTQILGSGSTSYPSATNASTLDTKGSISGLFINNGKLYACRARNSWIITMNLSDIYSYYLTPINIPITNFAGTGVESTNAAITTPTKATDITLNQPYGLTFDKYNNTYIADFQAGSIKKVDTSGYITNFFDSNSQVGMRPPTGFKPIGTCCDKNNNKIYVSDNFNGTILLIT